MAACLANRRAPWRGVPGLARVLMVVSWLAHQGLAFLLSKGPSSLTTSNHIRTSTATPTSTTAASRSSWQDYRRAPLIRTLLIDNYDSYTYNLAHYLAEVNGLPPIVVYNDAHGGDWEALMEAVGPFDNIVLSPGPGTPENPEDFGLCRPALEQPHVPVLGICLGHQGLAHLHGAKVQRLEGGPMHGRLSPVFHTGKDVFRGLPQGFQVVRYHSLGVDRVTLSAQDTLRETVRSMVEALVHPFPPFTLRKAVVASLRTQMLTLLDASVGFLFGQAWTPDGVLMGLQHRGLPQWGVQFHPESVATEHGHTLLANFRDLTLQHKRKKTSFKPPARLAPTTAETGRIRRLSWDRGSTSTGMGHEGQHQLLVRKVALPDGVDSEVVFRAVYGESHFGSFWLDSSSSQGKYSFMGDAQGPLGHVLEYSTASGDAAQDTVLKVRRPPSGGRQSKGQEEEEEEEVHRGQSMLAFLKAKLSEWRQGGLSVGYLNAEGAFQEVPEHETSSFLPFDFRGGYVGYLGYELQHDCLRIQQDASQLEWREGKGGAPHATSPSKEGRAPARDVPDALLTFADRFLAVDHEAGQVYIMALTASSAPSGQDTLAWQAGVEAKIHSLRPVPNPPARWLGQKAPGGFIPLTSQASYKSQVGGCFEALLSGDSYEICLTNPFLLPQAGINPRQLYSRLRRQNPAPYAAFLLHDPSRRLGGSPQDVRSSSSSSSSSPPLSQDAEVPSVGVCCSSPERFLKITRGPAGEWMVESKPIKGTIRRGLTRKEDLELAQELAGSDKNRAENLMIVDLVRNDVARVCEAGSVKVPSLMNVESYATVHQLVSTVRGRLQPRYDVVDTIVASFPGGSMTGAPKVRTMAIINELEGRPRGVYSGTLGFISVDGAADLNIVIRTAVVTPQNVTVSAGGAVVWLSSVEEEYNEMILKARAVTRVVASEGIVAEEVEGSRSPSAVANTSEGDEVEESRLETASPSSRPVAQAPPPPPPRSLVDTSV